MSILPLARIISLGLVCHAGIAFADPAPQFGTLLAQARGRAPVLAQSESDVARAEGLARQGALRPNPVAEVTVEDFGGTGPLQTFRSAQTTARFGLPLELGGKRPARIAAGRAAVDAALARYTVAGFDYAFNLASAYAAAEAAAARLALATEAVALAGDDVRVATALVRAGKEADLRRVQAETARQAALAALETARAENATALAQLSALAGVADPFTSVPPSLFPHADLVVPLLQPNPLTTPKYLAAVAEREAALRRVRVERTKRFPDLTVSLGVRRNEADNAGALVAGISVPLPLFDRNQGNIAAAAAEESGAAAALRAARLDAESGIRSAQARLEASFSRVRASQLGEQTAEEAYRLSRIGYEGGKLPLSEVLLARRALSDARSATIDARIERLSAEAELARLAGQIPFGDVR
ncbi:MAG: TolC family protein [Sphingomonadales bacterium]|nr:TolC family protein [Sphingomonadales bacterium]MDE2570771.1 TolC family protein [Sphingomonadales bacterium]